MAGLVGRVFYGLRSSVLPSGMRSLCTLRPVMAHSRSNRIRSTVATILQARWQTSGGGSAADNIVDAQGGKIGEKKPDEVFMQHDYVFFLLKILDAAT
jgi:hypothetical protein